MVRDMTVPLPRVFFMTLTPFSRPLRLYLGKPRSFGTRERAVLSLRCREFFVLAAHIRLQAVRLYGWATPASAVSFFLMRYVAIVSNCDQRVKKLKCLRWDIEVNGSWREMFSANLDGSGMRAYHACTCTPFKARISPAPASSKPD